MSTTTKKHVWENPQECARLWDELVAKFTDLDHIGFSAAGKLKLQQEYSRAGTIDGLLRIFHGDSSERRYILRKMRLIAGGGILWDEIGDEENRRLSDAELVKLKEDEEKERKKRWKS